MTAPADGKWKMPILSFVFNEIDTLYANLILYFKFVHISANLRYE